MNHVELLDNLSLDLIGLIDANQAHHYRIIPQMNSGQEVAFFHDANHTPNTEELTFLLGKSIQLIPIASEPFDRYLYQYYPHEANRTEPTEQLEEGDSDIIRLVDQIFQDGVNLGASDIHLERYEDRARVRYRWEGKLIEKQAIQPQVYNALVSRLKILAELDIAEKRLPQDGRIRLDQGPNALDVRLSTVPGKFGEKVVMRLLSRAPRLLRLENLGMGEAQVEIYKEALKYPNGIILITGPTGSGKTTTLYASLTRLNTADVNILTVEDPIEYNLSGINQIQVKPDIGLTFERALRAFLRQDPDVIMVGEIRDAETATIAMRASLTGHLVFSTLHTNSTLDAIPRLIDMGVPPYVLAASLRLIVAQRLVRLCCPHCTPQNGVMHTSSKTKGCPRCNYTGFSGRKAIYELLPINATVRERIKTQNINFEEIQSSVPGFSTLKESAQNMVNQGLTTAEEVYAILED